MLKAKCVLECFLARWAQPRAILQPPGDGSVGSGGGWPCPRATAAFIPAPGTRLPCCNKACSFPCHSSAISGLCLNRILSVYFDIEITAVWLISSPPCLSPLWALLLATFRLKSSSCYGTVNNSAVQPCCGISGHPPGPVPWGITDGKAEAGFAHGLLCGAGSWRRGCRTRTNLQKLGHLQSLVHNRATRPQDTRNLRVLPLPPWYLTWSPLSGEADPWRG